MSEITVRVATPDDAEALLRLYAPYVRETAITFEYDVPSVEEFRGRIAHTLEQYPYLVAEVDGKPVGYAYVSGFKDRIAYSWSVETSIYVDMDYRRGGVGRALLERLEAELKALGITNMNACIAVPAEGVAEDPYLTRNSVEFHEHMGYRLVGEFKLCAQKFNRWYNMVWMERLIADHTPGAPAPTDFSARKK